MLVSAVDQSALSERTAERESRLLDLKYKLQLKHEEELIGGGRSGSFEMTQQMYFHVSN